jgi:hypothetical protein
VDVDGAEAGVGECGTHLDLAVDPLFAKHGHLWPASRSTKCQVPSTKRRVRSARRRFLVLVT